MTPEELLKPRVLVATDWPGRRDFEVGQIILLDKIFGDGSPMWEITDCQGTRRYIKKFFEMFPLQFKFLEWWEEREEYFWIEGKTLTPLFVSNVVKTFYGSAWAIDLETGRFTLEVKGDKTKAHLSNYIPATESEYNEYIKSKE